ncbi:MAG: class I SAM-dependent methyltransferase [Methanomassiliicoccales archaeon]|jgi:hypothetical protein
MLIKTSADEFWIEARKLVRATSTVLDIGCGIRPQDFFEPDIHICLDPHEEYLNHLAKNLTNEKKRHVMTIKGDWALAPKIFPSRSVDSLFLLDIIEHVDKEQAIQFLKECEDLVREQIVIFTPLGFLPQELEESGLDGWGLHGGEWQVHRSGWMPEDFGDQWDFLVCDDFHKVDGQGNRLDHPYGAFFAFLNLGEIKVYGIKEYRRLGFKKVEKILDRIGI